MKEPKIEASLIHLTRNQPPDRFYRGGSKIARFRGVDQAGDRVPEDWIASTTTLFGEASLGLSELPSGSELIEEVERDPTAWLGQAHVNSYGADTKMLLKLLDAGQRLPVHVHPDSGFADRVLGARHGKAEAWYILEGGTIRLGFREPESMQTVQNWVHEQDVAGMLAAMNEITVEPGDTVFVPPRTAHSIGEGIFLVEIQEPADLSILLEWTDFAIDGATLGHLGLGFDSALLALNRAETSRDEVERLVVRASSATNKLPDAAAPYFRLEQYSVSSPIVLEAGYGVVVVLEGEGAVRGANGEQASLRRGDSILTAYSAGDLTIYGDVQILRCRPPRVLTEIAAN